MPPEREDPPSAKRARSGKQPARRTSPRTPAAPAAKNNTSLPAKLAAPRLGTIYPRVRLFERLDEARRSPVVWISAPAGAGKTTLVSSYVQARHVPSLWYQVDEGDDDLATFFHYLSLAARQASPRSKPLPQFTPEYQTGLATFTRNVFRELFRHLRRPAVLILDNYQDVPAVGPLHECLAVGLGEIPDGINVLVVSRLEPPPAFARLLANGDVESLEWPLLQLTDEEGAGIARLRLGAGSVAETIGAHLLPQAQGWIAGLVLLLERERTKPAAQPPQINDLSRIFDYFASEIFRHLEPATQSFLLTTAFLPKMTLRGAEQLTGNREAARLLQDLTRRNYFTVRRTQGSYEYHPLFRSFLTTEAANRLTAEHVRQLQRQCAQILAADGEAEMAVTLLQQARDWSAFVPLVLGQARSLIEQGRTRTLAGWLLALPETVRTNDGWVLYWLGVCRLLYQPREARGYFEEAFALFERGAVSDPLYLAWTGIIDSFLIEWHDFRPSDKWIDLYPSLQTGRTPPAAAVEVASLLSYVAALIYHRPDDSALEEHAVRAETMLRGDSGGWFTQAATLVYGTLWVRKLAAGERLLRMMAPHAGSPNIEPPARILWHSQTSLHLLVTGAPAECSRVAAEGLSLADEHGVHAFDHILAGHYVLGQLCCGKVGNARALVERILPDMRHATVRDSFFLFAAACTSFHEGNLARAEQEADLAVRFNPDGGVLFGDTMNRLGRAVIRARRGDTERALTEIAGIGVEIERIASPTASASWALAEANVRFWRSEHALALRALEVALRVLSEDGRIFLPAWQLREDAAALCNLALDAGIHGGFVQQLIVRLQLPVPAEAVSESWPFALRIFTLGRFAILRDGLPIQFAGKVQKKTLELIKALIAFGGRDVPETRLCDALWPDAAAHLARQNLKATLHRGRKLVGAEAISVTDGKLSINPACSWCDVWSFERYLNAALASQTDGAPALTAALDAALNLARGAFLGTEDLAFVLQTRERLRSKLLRVLARATRVLRAEGATERSVEYAEKGLDLDPLAESLYQDLMRAWLALGRNADALAVYERCRRQLGALLGISPSPETESLRRQALGGRSGIVPPGAR